MVPLRKLPVIICSLLIAGILCLTVFQLVRQFFPTENHTYLPAAQHRPTPTPLSAEQASVLLNLNAATYEQLTALPGIGAKTAEAILALRSQLGRFRYKEDLLLVSGIGEKKLNAIYDLIYVQ